MADELAEMFEEAMTEPSGEDNLEVVEVDESTVEDASIPEDDGADVETDFEDEVSEESISDDEVGDDSEFDFGKIIEQYGDQEVEVTVQGKPVKVPLRDLPNRVMMQEDYTQKTQELSQLANWARQVQEGFATDPQGMLQAFAEAYRVQQQPSQPDQPQVDPYEDLDPDVAAVLRQKDAAIQQAMSKLEQIESTQNNFVRENTMREVRAEFEQVKADFPDVPPDQMLQVAAAYNMPLAEAATLLEGKRLREERSQVASASEEAGKLVQDSAKASKAKAKKQATAAGKRQLRAGDVSQVSKDDFSSIGELLEMAINSTG